MLTIKISFLKNANPFTKKKESKYEMKSTAIRNNFLFQCVFKNNIPTKINFSEMERAKDFFLKMQKIKQ